MNTEGIIEHIVGWLKDYAERSGAAGFVVGVSGGIDSAVTSALAARTGFPVIGLEMPIHQQRSQQSRARAHLESLARRFDNVRSESIDLSDAFDRLVDALPVTGESGLRALALANSRARLRMTALYYVAAAHRFLVTGTGNKIEDFGVGFFTKYGDGGVDVSPIADLVKTEVYRLGAALDVSPEIMRAAPTDGLWGDHRSDEDQLGASYEELERAMAHVESGAPERDVSAREAEVLAIYRRLHEANRHKMTPIPVCSIPDRLRE